MDPLVTREPIRVPVWIATLFISVVGPFLIALLTYVNWREALAAAIGSAILIVAPAEVVRGRIDSPATVARRLGGRPL